MCEPSVSLAVCDNTLVSVIELQAGDCTNHLHMFTTAVPVIDEM